MARGQDTRTRILDTAQDAVLSKGFAGTSIDEIVAAVEITKGGFFYHFPDKNALATALIQRYIDDEDRLFDDLQARARELSDDPLQGALIFLRLLAELLDDMADGHPGCLVATSAYQDRLFDRTVQDLNRRAIESWRARFRAMFEEVAASYPPREDVSLDDLADMVSGAVEGGIILAKATQDPGLMAKQVLQLRTYVKLLFSPRVS